MQLLTILSTVAVLWVMGVAVHRTVQGQQTARILIRQGVISVFVMLLIVVQSLLSILLS